MGVFDKNIQHPLEHLYDECKEICNYIIPMNLQHYNATAFVLEMDIIRELKHRGLYCESSINDESGYQKICRVECARRGTDKLGIPVYRVFFYYNYERYYGVTGNMMYRQGYLSDFDVSLMGVQKREVPSFGC